VRRTKDAVFFDGILKKINTTQWSSERSFRRKRKRFGKKVYTVREQNLRDVEPCEFERKFSEREKLYFYPTLTHSKQSKKPFLVYRFVEPWRFVLQVQPDLITKVRIKDLDLERERDRIGKYLDTIPRRARLAKLLSGRTYRLYGSALGREYKSPLHNRGFHDILDEYLPENTMTISIRNPRDNEGFLFFLLLVLTAFCRRSTTLSRIHPSLRRKCPRIEKSFPSTFRKKN
jgi:hypothetical protein